MSSPNHLLYNETVAGGDSVRDIYPANCGDCPLALINEANMMISRSVNDDQRTRWERHKEETIEAHQYGWWCALRLDDRQPY
eukprot:11982524-Karenia_brevis.AAC.1